MVSNKSVVSGGDIKSVVSGGYMVVILNLARMSSYQSRKVSILPECLWKYLNSPN